MQIGFYERLESVNPFPRAKCGERGGGWGVELGVAGNQRSTGRKWTKRLNIDKRDFLSVSHCTH